MSQSAIKKHKRADKAAHAEAEAQLVERAHVDPKIQLQSMRLGVTPTPKIRITGARSRRARSISF